MQRRFFVEIPIQGTVTEITGPDAHHIRNVNRMDVGDTITLFDGCGSEFDAKITELQKKSVALEIVGEQKVSREIDGELILAVALPKGDRQKIVVEKLVELGVTKLIPIVCERSVAQIKDKSIERLNRWVIEASKQCGRNVLMKIDSSIPVGELFSMYSDSICFFAHPYGQAIDANEAGKKTGIEDSVVVAIGPEGGFSEGEVQLANQSEWKSLRLGRSILRVETAAAAAATIFGMGRSS